MRNVVVVAAMDLEVKAIAAAFGQTGTCLDLGNTRLFLVAKGPGFRLARKALDSVGVKPDALVSTGICGALDPNLAVGDVFVAPAVNGFPCRLPQTLRKFASGPMLSQDRVAATADEKRRLRAGGALAVDMEAAVVGERSRELEVPFYCVRAVSDAAGEDFLMDLNAARGSDGDFSVLKLLGQVVLSPAKKVPELFRLKRNSELAARRLGEFFADCSF